MRLLFTGIDLLLDVVKKTAIGYMLDAGKESLVKYLSEYFLFINPGTYIEILEG